MRLILKVHEASAAQYVEQIILILASIYILLKVILEGLRNLGAVSSIFCSLCSNFCSFCKLLIFRLSSSSLSSFVCSLLKLCLSILSVKVLGSLVVLFQALIIIIIIAVALCRPSTVRCTNNGVYTLTKDSCLGWVTTDILITYDLLAGNDTTFCSYSDIYVMELITIDDTGSIRRCLLNMDDSAVKLRNRNSQQLLAWLKRVLDLYAFQVVNTFHGSSLLFADTPELNKSGALHHTYRQVRKTQRCSMKLKHQNVLRIILICKLTLLDSCTETTSYVGVTRVCSIAVDVGSHTALTD